MFVEEWNKFFPDSEPLAWKAREVHVDKWFRIYSLPEGKRYPETDHERVILLYRHNKVASDVLGEGSACWLSWYGKESAGLFNGVKICNYKDDWIETTVYATEVFWGKGDHDEFILKIADEKVSSSIFLNRQSGDVYAPYDGGADIFIQDNNRRIELMARFSEWVPRRKDGL